MGSVGAFLWSWNMYAVMRSSSAFGRGMLRFELAVFASCCTAFSPFDHVFAIRSVGL
jgi:hypothetical protein